MEFPNFDDLSYVPKYDNKYVQYRLMSTSFSTDEADWQGVDDELIKGSRNLIDGGTVYKGIGQVKKLSQERVVGYSNENLTRGGYYGIDTGLYIETSNACSAKIEIPDDVNYISFLNYRDNSAYEGVLFFDVNDQYIQDSFIRAKNKWKCVAIPANAHYVAINAVYLASGEITEKIVLMSTPLFIEEDATFHSGELLKNVDIDDSIEASNTGLAKSGRVAVAIDSKIETALDEALNNDVVVETLSYTKTTYSGPITEFDSPLPKNTKYTITINATGDRINDMRKFYLMSTNSLSGENIEFTGMSALNNGPVIIEANPTFDVKFVTLQAISTWSGTANISISVKKGVEKYLTENQLETIVNDKITTNNIDNIGVQINIFGDILPEQFKTKLLETNDDLLIVCQGDSIVGLTQNCNPSPDVSHDCPGGQYQGFVYLLQKIVGKVKPYYNRLDSQRNNADFFAKTGIWAVADRDTFSPDGNPAIAERSKEASITCLTYRSNSEGASISFSFDSDVYEKCNIIFPKNKEAGSMVLTIQQGNGKLLASIDRVNWVEANGFSHSQATNEWVRFNGEAQCERHRRLWLKKADSTITGVLNLTYSKVGNDSNYVYCWGTEMYSGRGIFFDNIGRDGRKIIQLSENISDIFDRNPDLTLIELPLANDTHSTDYDESTLLNSNYNNYFLHEERGCSYRTRSSNYTNYPLIVILPHPRAAAFDGDKAIFFPSGYMQSSLAYDLYKKVWAYIRTNLKTYNNVKFVDICDQFLNEAKYRYGNWHDGLAGGSLTADNIHLNQKGADIYNKYLSPIFQV